MSPASMEPEHCNKKGIADDDGDRSKEEVHKHTRRYMGLGRTGVQIRPIFIYYYYFLEILYSFGALHIP